MNLPFIGKSKKKTDSDENSNQQATGQTPMQSSASQNPTQNNPAEQQSRTASFNKPAASQQAYTEVSTSGRKATKAEVEASPASKLAKGIPSVRDLIAPSAIEVDFNHLKIGDRYFRTLFVSGYPRFVGANWLEPIINFDHTITISMFYYPMNARNVLDDLRRKIAEMEATINIAREKGKVVDPGVQAALSDAKSLQEQLVKGIERFFHFSFYVTISAESLEELNNVTYQVESTLGSMSLISKKATLEMEAAFQSTIPVCMDKLKIIRNMDTTSVATTFPFTSSELTANEGILYGVNKHNGSLVIFDRFSLENANSVIFATSGAGKSYLVKLEALRSLLFGVDIIVLDPEMEYKRLCDAVGGEYIDFSINSEAKINPFDLPVVPEVEDQLSMKILSLHALFKIMLGDLTSAESAVLDRALIDTYRLKGITQDPTTQQNSEPPLMEDLYKVLQAMDEPESKSIAERLERYIKGSLAGVFDQRSNINLENSFTVFSIRNLQDVLRPIAMFMILDFIWTKVKHDLKKRLLLIDEAWTLMQYPDSAAFVYSLAKRSRKYYLGMTTISQDVNDFLSTDYGKAVVTNSSIQMLLKQHPASIESLSNIFYLSEGEKSFLLSAGIGEGLFFAGTNHVALNIKASPQEHQLITTNPQEIAQMKQDEQMENMPLTNRQADRVFKSQNPQPAPEGDSPMPPAGQSPEQPVGQTPEQPAPQPASQTQSEAVGGQGQPQAQTQSSAKAIITGPGQVPSAQTQPQPQNINNEAFGGAPYSDIEKFQTPMTSGNAVNQTMPTAPQTPPQQPEQPNQSQYAVTQGMSQTAVQPQSQPTQTQAQGQPNPPESPAQSQPPTNQTSEAIPGQAPEPIDPMDKIDNHSGADLNSTTNPQPQGNQPSQPEQQTPQEGQENQQNNPLSGSINL